jgi:uncharacterized membrane protein
MPSRTKKFLLFFAILSVLLLSVGIASVVLAGEKWGFGFLGGGIGGCVATGIWFLYVVLFPRKAKEAERREYDERGTAVRGRSSYFTFWALLAVLVIAEMVSGMFERLDLALLFVAVATIQIIFYFAAYFYYRKKL